MGIGNTLEAILTARPTVSNHQHYDRKFSCTGSSNCARHLGLSYMVLRVHFHHLLRNLVLMSHTLAIWPLTQTVPTQPSILQRKENGKIHGSE